MQIRYDPKEVPYENLLEVFWSVHNPNTSDRQGPDVGTQYRSMIIFHTREQEVVAQSSKAELNKSGRFMNRIVTEIVLASQFFKAEEYHLKYYQRRGGGSCYF